MQTHRNISKYFHKFREKISVCVSFTQNATLHYTSGTSLVWRDQAVNLRQTIITAVTLKLLLSEECYRATIMTKICCFALEHGYADRIKTIP